MYTIYIPIFTHIINGADSTFYPFQASTSSTTECNGSPKKLRILSCRYGKWWNVQDSLFNNVHVRWFRQIQRSNFWVMQMETFSVGLIYFFHTNSMICEYIKCVNMHSSSDSVGTQHQVFLFKVLDAEVY